MNGSTTSRKRGRLLALAVTLTLLAPAGTLMAQTSAEQIREFVQAVHIEGVPYERASKLDPEVALPVLRQVLADPAQQDHWANAAVTAGMIGDDRSADLLIEFVTRPETSMKLPRAQTVAKTSAVMALGYVVNKTGNRKALEFLKAGTDPQSWAKRKLTWSGEFHGNLADQNRHLATMSVLGLGISGNAEAASALRSLREAPKSPRARALKQSMPGLDALADEALKANGAIAREGIDSYYLKIQPKQATTVRGTELAPRQEAEATKPPVSGEVLKQPTPGEVLKEPQPGEQLAQPKTGKVLRPLTKGEVISPPK